MLLGSMVYSASEQAQVFLIGRSKAVEPVAMTGSVLKDVQVLWQAAQVRPLLFPSHILALGLLSRLSIYSRGMNHKEAKCLYA